MNCHNSFDAATGFGGYKESGSVSDGRDHTLVDTVLMLCFRFALFWMWRVECMMINSAIMHVQVRTRGRTRRLVRLSEAQDRTLRTHLKGPCTIHSVITHFHHCQLPPPHHSLSSLSAVPTSSLTFIIVTCPHPITLGGQVCEVE